VDECIVPGCEDVANSEDVTARILRTKGSFLLGFSSLFGSFFSFSSLLLGVLSSRSFSLFSLCRLNLGHNIKLIFYKYSIFLILMQQAGHHPLLIKILDLHNSGPLLSI